MAFQFKNRKKIHSSDRSCNIVPRMLMEWRLSCCEGYDICNLDIDWNGWPEVLCVSRTSKYFKELSGASHHLKPYAKLEVENIMYMKNTCTLYRKNILVGI